jgi:transcriptional adapter 3
VAVNNARKDRLLQVTKERLAYSEYKKVLEGLEKLIEQAWTKRYAALKKAGKKQKGKAREHAAAADGAVPLTALTPSKRREGVPPLSDQVKLAMSARRRWLDTVGHALENDPVAGRYRGLPQQSIYEGIDERGREIHPLRVAEEQEGHELVSSPGMMQDDG